jgi:hypothetical protein
MVSGVLAISIRQPWAWLICEGRDPRGEGKPVENRDWSTDYRGELLIHAGLQPYPGFEEIRRNVRDEFGIEIPPLAELPRGGIVGQANLVMVLDGARWRPEDDDPRWDRFRDSRWRSGSRYPWCLDDARPLPFRRCPGQLKLFHVDYAALPAPVGYARQVSFLAGVGA